MELGYLAPYLEWTQSRKRGLGIVGLGKKRFFAIPLSYRFVGVISALHVNRQLFFYQLELLKKCLSFLL